MVYKFFDEKSSGSGHPSSSALLIVNNDTKQNLQLAEELHKPIIKEIKKKFIQDLKIICGVLI